MKTLSIAVVFGIVFILTGCGEESFQDWQRHWVANMEMGQNVELGLRQENAFKDIKEHCIQQINYTNEDGELKTSQIEIYNIPCENKVLAEENRIGRYAMASRGGSIVEFGENTERPFGRIREEGTFSSSRLIMDALCNFADATQAERYGKNCTVNLKDDKIESIQPKP